MRGCDARGRDKNNVFNQWVSTLSNWQFTIHKTQREQDNMKIYICLDGIYSDRCAILTMSCDIPKNIQDDIMRTAIKRLQTARYKLTWVNQTWEEFSRERATMAQEAPRKP